MIESRILGADPRLKILLAITLGMFTWRTNLPGLLLYIASLGAVCWVLRSALPGQRYVLKSYGWFLLLWIGAKFGLDIWMGVDAVEAAKIAIMLGLRLSCLLLVGLALALSTSARKLGVALTWFLRPFMGRQSWQAALALALMVHFLPITWLTLAEVRQTVNRRCGHLGFFRRMLLMGQASLRGLGQKTWNQTLAVACRRLDQPEAWLVPFSASYGQWVLFVLFGAVSAGVAAL